MKKGLLLGVVPLLFTVLPLTAQQPPAVVQTAPAAPAAPRPHSLSLEVVPVSRGGESHVLDEKAASRLGYEYGHNSDPRGTRSASMTVNTDKQTLQVNVRNFGPVPDTAQIEAYFIAQYVGMPWPKNTRFYKELPKEYVFDHSVKPLAIPANSTSPLTVESVEVRTLATKFTGTSTRGSGFSTTSSNETGTKLHAWIIRLVADGKVLAVRASTSSYEELGKDDAQLQALVAIPIPDEPRNRRTVGPFSQ